MQSLPLLSNQRPSELLDKMLILLPEDEKHGLFFRELFMDQLPTDIRAHLLSEFISDPRRMALRADELWTIPGRSIPVLSDQCKDVYALPCRNSSTRSGACGSVPRSDSLSSVPEDDRRFSFSGVCCYHRPVREMQLANAELPVPIWETSWRQEFHKLDSCRFFYLKLHILAEFFILSQVSG